MPRSEFPKLKSGDALEPWHMNVIYRELERWNKAGAGGGIAFQNRAGGPYWSLVAGLGVAVIKTTGAITARAGANPGSGPATVQDYDSGTNALSDSTTTIAAVRNLFDAVPSGSYTLAVSALGEWWNVPLGGSGSGGGALERCACPESHYEVTTTCGPCGKMPRYWWLTLSAASLASGATPCSGTDCADLEGLRFRLANNDDPDAAGCTWEISANGCLSAELTWDASGERWKLTLTDKDACVLGIWYAASADFACCGGTNATWTPDEANVCAVTISLAPDDCTCCPADPVVCPPDGLPFCESSTCCIAGESNCTITVLVYDFDDPDPMGHVHDPANCLEMGGTYVMHWVGDCTWKGEIGTGTPEVYHATLTLAGSTWTLVINGSDGQTATLQATTCLPEVHLLLVSTSCQQVGGTPEVTGVDHATFTLAV